MGVRRENKKRHRGKLEKVDEGTYKLGLYQKKRGNYSIESFLFENSMTTGALTFDKYNFQATPTQVNPKKCITKTLNEE